MKSFTRVGRHFFCRRLPAFTTPELLSPRLCADHLLREATPQALDDFSSRLSTAVGLPEHMSVTYTNVCAVIRNAHMIIIRQINTISEENLDTHISSVDNRTKRNRPPRTLPPPPSLRGKPHYLLREFLVCL